MQPGRRRFSIAHELGHFVLGHELPREAEITTFVSRACERRRSIDEDPEREADAFYTEYLTPEVNPWQLMEWMGHKRIDETMGYVHIAERHRSIPAEIVSAGMKEVDPTARIAVILSTISWAQTGPKPFEAALHQKRGQDAPRERNLSLPR